MAQGDVVSIGLGDTVRISVTLDLKKAQLDRRDDRDRFNKVAFTMREKAKNKEVSGTPIFNFDTSLVTGDDQVVQVEARFVNQTQAPGTFQQGDIWDVFIQYRNANGDSHNDQDRTHFLGRIGIGVTPPRGA